jgi:hypothetical protein
MKPIFLISLFLALTTPTLAEQSRWVQKVETPTDGLGYSLFIPKCGFLGCQDGKKIYGTIEVGQTKNGINVGAIRCEKEPKTVRGWPGGPKYIALAGKWNCQAAKDRFAVLNSPGPNGERPNPWISVTGADL